MEMHTGEFWTRIYDLPLKLRSNEMAKKLGDLLGKFVEVDSKESNRLGCFLRVKANIDLRKPLKRGTVIKYQDVLSALLKKEVSANRIHGLQVARKAPKILHLFFADDSLLFARANSFEADCIMDTLSRYQTASGQVVNLDKSEASFSRNVHDEVKDMIRNRMEVKTVMSHSRYLGLPVVFGRSKKEIFSFVIDRVWKKIKGWKERFLSRAGKETLIKAVAQAIPSYIMSCYKLPEGCCKDIEAMLARFW